MSRPLLEIRVCPSDHIAMWKLALSSPCIVLLAGCFLFHGRGEGEPSGADASEPPTAPEPDGGSPPMDASSPPSGPDGSPFVPTDADVPVAPPRAELTCDSGDEELRALCGELRVLHVAPGGDGEASGTPSDPFGSLKGALGACAAGCEIRLARGELALEPDSGAPPCAHITGGWAPDDAGWTPTTERTTLRGIDAPGVGLRAGRRLLVEGVEIREAETAIGAGRETDLLVVRDVAILASRDGIHTSGSRGVRICRVRIEAEYNGITLSWGTEDVVIEDVDIDAGYGGVSIGRESSSVVIRDSDIRGGYEGVGVSWSSHDVVIEGSTIDGGYEGIGVSWSSHTVVIRGSVVGGCYEPVGVSHGSHTVQITNSTTGECTEGPYDSDAGIGGARDAG